MESMKISPNRQLNTFDGKNAPVKTAFPCKTEPSKDITMPSFSANYFHPSFGMNANNVTALRAKKLQEIYAKKGFRYLLPNETWSDKRILNTVSLFGEKINTLIKSENLTKSSIQNSIKSILPKGAIGKIIVKDFTDLEKDLKASEYSKENIDEFLKSIALTFNNHENSTIYLNFKNLKQDEISVLNFKKHLQHELKHALSNNFQNTLQSDLYKNFGNNRLLNNLFAEFEQNYKKPYNLDIVELNKENMLNFYGFNSLNELHNNFETKLNQLAQDKNLSKEPENFFTYLKHKAKDEKEATLSNKVYRDFYKNSEEAEMLKKMGIEVNFPTDTEFETLLYTEMENFFTKKEQSLKQKRKIQ